MDEDRVEEDDSGLGSNSSTTATSTTLTTTQISGLYYSASTAAATHGPTDFSSLLTRPANDETPKASTMSRTSRLQQLKLNFPPLAKMAGDVGAVTTPTTRPTGPITKGMSFKRQVSAPVEPMGKLLRSPFKDLTNSGRGTHCGDSPKSRLGPVVKEEKTPQKPQVTRPNPRKRSSSAQQPPHVYIRQWSLQEGGEEEMAHSCDAVLEMRRECGVDRVEESEKKRRRSVLEQAFEHDDVSLGGENRVLANCENFHDFLKNDSFLKKPFSPNQPHPNSSPTSPPPPAHSTESSPPAPWRPSPPRPSTTATTPRRHWSTTPCARWTGPRFPTGRSAPSPSRHCRSC